MRISKKAEYALRALFVLAQSRPDRPYPIQDLSERENIPIKFLEQILLSLRREGLLESKRGVGGGYQLARPATEITVGEVIRLIDGPLAPVACAAAGTNEKCTCRDPRTCPLRLAMTEVASAMSGLLDDLTLRDAVDRVPAEARLSFEI
jgi:Rrf2 family protein